MYDCRNYSDNELSLVIMNDEYLYLLRHRLNKEDLQEMGIKYTSKQWEVFKQDLLEEEE